MSVVTLFFTDSHGETTRVQSDPGNSLMRAAVDSGIDAIEAVCGGNAQCATCHVYVDPTQLGLLPPLRDAENETLDETAAPRRSNSRLSCQIMLTSSLDGLRVETPDRQ